MVKLCLIPCHTWENAVYTILVTTETKLNTNVQVRHKRPELISLEPVLRIKKKETPERKRKRETEREVIAL